MWNVVNYYVDSTDFNLEQWKVCVILFLEAFIAEHAM